MVYNEQYTITEDDYLPHYLPEFIPDNLFTRNGLRKMRRKTKENHVGFVYYPEQKRKYKLYDVNKSYKFVPKTDNPLTVYEKVYTLEEMLERRKNEIELRAKQLM